VPGGPGALRPSAAGASAPSRAARSFPSRSARRAAASSTRWAAPTRRAMDGSPRGREPTPLRCQPPRGPREL